MPVEYRDHCNLIGFNEETNNVRKTLHKRLPHIPIRLCKLLRRCRHAIERTFNGCDKLFAQTSPLLLVPKVRVQQVGFSFWFKDKRPSTHLPRIRRLTSAHDEAAERPRLASSR